MIKYDKMFGNLVYGDIAYLNSKMIEGLKKSIKTENKTLRKTASAFRRTLDKQAKPARSPERANSHYIG